LGGKRSKKKKHKKQKKKKRKKKSKKHHNSQNLCFIPIVLNPIDGKSNNPNIEKLDDVESAIVDRSVRIEWEYATTVDRFNSAIVDVLRTIGMTEDQIDDLFIAAKNY
jgi:hypothetical protein